MMLLKPVEKIIHLIAGTKSCLYKKGIIKPVRLDVPVISIGNLTFGGVGKTPFVLFLAEELSQNKKIVVVTKSYKASLKMPQKVDLNLKNAAQVFGDEACLIQSKMSSVCVWSGPQKYQTATASLVDQPEVIILDDGFSHQRLSRKFDLVLVDATQGFDLYLREPLTALKRAHAILITKTNLVNNDKINRIKNQILNIDNKFIGNIFTSKTRTELNIDKSFPLYIFCGLGRPESFFEDLKQQGFQIVHKKYFEDHHQYSVEDQKELCLDFQRLQKNYPEIKLVTTEKDFVKLTDDLLINNVNLPVHVIEIDNAQKESLLEKIRQSL